MPLENLCICDAILNGGETAALAVIEAVSRLLPGFLGKKESVLDESFSSGLLEYPQYTRPECFEGLRVPEVLLNGNHAAISSYRRLKALERTAIGRPELLAETALDHQDAQWLADLPRKHWGRNLSFCLFHYPVRLENGRVGASSLTNLDIHDIARISYGYGLGPFYALTPLDDQRALLEKLLAHWADSSSNSHQDRKDALRKVIPVASIQELERDVVERCGAKPTFIVTSAQWPKKKPAIAFGEVRKMCGNGPVIICLGTARGLAMDKLPFPHEWLRPARFMDESHFSVRAAAALMADRILGDFY